MAKEVFGKIVAEIQSIIFDASPDAKERAMYGGLVYESNCGEKKRLFCGIFVRKEYVSLELDGGPALVDPSRILEGEGKTRRHIKLFAVEDIKKKKVKAFIKQALKLQSS